MTSVLFVDDEPNVLGGIRRLLHRYRDCFDVSYALGGQEALDVLKTTRFDLVVSDLRMPGVDGSAVLSLARDRYPETVRAVLSGYADQDVLFRQALTGHLFLSKPCDPDQLVFALHRVQHLADRLPSSPLRRLAGAVDVLPCHPESVIRLAAILDNDQVSTEEITAVVAHDVGLTAKLMHLASAACQDRTKFAPDVPSAVACLGVGVIRQLIQVSAARQSPGSDGPHTALMDAVVRAVSDHARQITARLSSATDDPIARTLQLGAQLRDIGVLVLAAHRPAQLAQVLDVAQHGGADLRHTERLLWGADHLALGAYLAALWGLPTSVVAVIEAHREGWSEPPWPAPGHSLSTADRRTLVDCGALDLTHLADLSRKTSTVTGSTIR